MTIGKSGSIPKAAPQTVSNTPHVNTPNAPQKLPTTTGTQTPPAPAKEQKLSGPSWNQGPDGFGQSRGPGAKNTSGQTAPVLGTQARPMATGLNQNSSLQPNKANQQLAQQNGGVITAWVEQGRNPVVQKSSQHQGVCSVMVEDWCRQGLRGPGEEQQFRNKLNSNDYGSFVQDQRKADFTQQQMVKNEQFIVQNQHDPKLSGSASTLFNSNKTYDRNNNVPGLTSTQMVADRPLKDHASFAGDVKQQLNANPPADGQAAFYKMGLSNGQGGHAIGLKTENMGGQMRHSMLDPNTGEFMRIPDKNFTPFMNKYMDQNYGKDYQGGSWDLNKLQP